jgi:hypothetical protein
MRKFFGFSLIFLSIITIIFFTKIAFFIEDTWILYFDVDNSLGSDNKFLIRFLLVLLVLSSICKTIFLFVSSEKIAFKNLFQVNEKEKLLNSSWLKYTTLFSGLLVAIIYFASTKFFPILTKEDGILESLTALLLLTSAILYLRVLIAFKKSRLEFLYLCFILFSLFIYWT